MSYGSGAVSAPTNWKVDGGIPYPNAAQVSPVLHAQLRIGDRPSAPKYKYGSFGPELCELWQKFETAVVGLTGTEGIVWHTQPLGGLGPSNSDVVAITVYDSVTWERRESHVLRLALLTPEIFWAMSAWAEATLVLHPPLSDNEWSRGRGIKPCEVISKLSTGRGLESPKV